MLFSSQFASSKRAAPRSAKKGGGAQIDPTKENKGEERDDTFSIG